MGCSDCSKKKIKPSLENLPNNSGHKIIINNSPNNIITAAKQQTNKFQWFRDGVTGIIKCLTGNSLYKDEDISQNREVCKNCEYSTRNADGKITINSQCMAPDPNNNNAPCGCVIVCKTQTGKCPLGKWTHLTVSINSPTKALNTNDLDVEI